MNLSEPEILQTLMKARTRLSASAWMVVRDTHAAEDIFQNVALKAMTREVRFESEAALLSWAFITARREGIDWLRRHQRETLGLDLDILERLGNEWQSALRILAADSEGARFELGTGQVWVSPPDRPSSGGLSIQTPTLVAEARHAQFYLQTTKTETTVRVNRGSAKVKQHVDGSTVDVPAGHQVTGSLSRPQPLAVRPRPEPGNSWTCDLGSLPKSVLGRWRSSTKGDGARLAAVPLLWPLPDQKCVLLHLAALSVLANSERPVLLEGGSRLAFRGRTTRAQTVRFGFVTQKPQGTFAGKFEMDVRPEALGPAGEDWEVSLPMAQFRPLLPELSFSPEGLELTDVYALTIREDAGLEIHHIELRPGPRGKPPTFP